MACHTAVTRAARHKPVHESADAAAQHLPQRPRLAEPPHQSVPVILGRLIIRRTDADVGAGDPRFQTILHRGIQHVPGKRLHLQIGAALFQPSLRQLGLWLADCGNGKQMPLDIVRFVNIRLDQGDARDARFAAEQIEHRHPAAAGANLDEMGHWHPPGPWISHGAALRPGNRRALTSLPAAAIRRSHARSRSRPASARLLARQRHT